MLMTILDNGLISHGEHSYAISSALKSRLNELRIESKIFGFRGLDETIRAELGCLPHFKHSLYGEAPATRQEMLRRRFAAKFRRSIVDQTPSEVQSVRVLNASYYEDLTSLPAETWAAGNIVLFPGIMQNQLLGLAWFVRERRASIQAKIICQLMFEPSWLPWGKNSKRIGPKTYRKAFDILRPLMGKQIYYTSENAYVSGVYKRVFHVDVSLLPIPLNGARAAENFAHINVGFFGYSKTEKGFHLLPEAIAICQSYRSDLNYFIQVQHSGGEKEIVDAEVRLRRNTGVTIVEGTLSPDEFASATSQIGIMLLPYDPVRFGVRGSGIFVESISAGRLIVASSEIWAGRCVTAGDAIGETFEPYTSEALAHAILRLCDGWEKKRLLALAKASDFEKKNSIGAYVDSIRAHPGTYDSR